LNNWIIFGECSLLLARQPPVGQGFLIHEVSKSLTTTHHIWYDSSGRVISSTQRPLPDKTQHSQHTNIHAPGGIQTQNSSKRAAADPRLRPLVHWDRLGECSTDHKATRYVVFSTPLLTRPSYVQISSIVTYSQTSSGNVFC
jgi:hypothetical protein